MCIQNYIVICRFEDLNNHKTSDVNDIIITK